MPTIIISSILVLIVAGIVYKMVRDKKRGKSGCGCGCQGCASEGMCHDEKN